MAATRSITEVRRQISHVVDEVVDKHQPAVVDRNGRDHFLMLGSDDAEQLLEEFQFHPEVFREPSAVSIWLPEFAIYGRGEDFSEAREDLLDEVRDYVEEYVKDADAYLRAPNRRRHYPYVVKALIADVKGDLEGVLFPEPQAVALEAS